MSASLIRIVGCLILVSVLVLPAGALAAPYGSETIHVVQWGETLSLIATQYGVTVEAIMAANGLTDPSFIYVGQRLVIPSSSGGYTGGGRHTVSAGETLTSIAWRYGTTVAALAAANGLSDTDFIYVGQVLNVPDGSSSPGGPVSGGCNTYYTVQWGDSLSGIAWRYGTTINALMQANGLYSDFIYQGQRLCVPPGGAAWTPSKPSYTYYTVRPGDTLSGVAWHFGVSQVAIMQANNLSNPSFIYVGQRLIIPGVASTAKGKTYRIAFARWEGGKHNLYVANTDGSDEKLLLERAAGPSWSPDGQRLSLFGEEGVDRQREDTAPVVFEGISNGILTIPASLPADLAQLDVVQIKRDGKARAAVWAPDGNAIAWDSNPGGNYYIYFYGKKDTSAEGQSAIEIPGEQPDWSPDGAQIAYRSGRDGKQGLWISDRYDSTARRITDDGSDAFPRWSPDGKRIAFHRESGGNVDVYVMNADGSDIRRLTDSPNQDTLPAWTPDGRIVFRSVRDGSWGIYIMDVNGRGQKQIIAYADPGPDWTFGQMDVY
jgi:LysM repeat protein